MPPGGFRAPSHVPFPRDGLPRYEPYSPLPSMRPPFPVGANGPSDSLPPGLPPCAARFTLPSPHLPCRHSHDNANCSSPAFALPTKVPGVSPPNPSASLPDHVAHSVFPEMLSASEDSPSPCRPGLRPSHPGRLDLPFPPHLPFLSASVCFAQESTHPRQGFGFTSGPARNLHVAAVPALSQLPPTPLSVRSFSSRVSPR
jgi:hypothetical protein